ncbi:2-hydroxy-3-oxopropionate reductase [archaeon HR06]|nr:2-hydroxy-3-oxopropionate reductase [archaeon HR06]
MKKVGFIGLGIMGKPMARNLLKAGFELTVYNRSKPPMEELIKLGAKGAYSPKEVAEVSEVVITMVRESSDVEQVMLGKNGVIEGIKEGSIAIDMGTTSLEVTRKLAEKFKSKGVKFLDAPVSGGDKGAIEGTLTIMVGGPKEAFEECLPIFKAMGKTITYMGDNGYGQLAKLCNQIMVSLNMLGIVEALTLAYKSGLDVNKLLEAVSAGAASSWALTNLAPKIIKRDFKPGFKVKLLQKDLRIIMSVVDELKLALPGTSLVHQLYNTLEAMNCGEEGHQALIKALERLNS